jgi:hypothetical protein
MSDLKKLLDQLNGISTMITESADPAQNQETPEQSNPVDTVTMDVPLLLRIMEYAREDAKTDMDLHHVAEQMIRLNQEQDHLSMDDYEAIIEKTQAPGESGVYESDISGLLAANQFNKSFIIKAETAEGVVKRFRVRHQSERLAREKFLQHHSQARIIDVKEEE